MPGSEAAPQIVCEVPGSDRGRELRSLGQNFGWTLAGNVVNAGAQWLVLVLIARLATPEAVGRYALASALATPVFLLTGLQLRSALATDAAGSFRFPDYLGLRVAGTFAALLATAAVLWIGGYDREAVLVVAGVALARAVEGLADMHYGVLQQHERMAPIGRSLMARGVVCVAVVGAILWAGGGLWMAVLAFAFSSGVVLLGYDVRSAAPLLRASGQGRLPQFHPPAMRRLLSLSLPLGLVNLAISLRTYLPRFFIEGKLGAAPLGVYAALSSFIAAGTLVIAALGQSATPRLAGQFHRGDVAGFRALLGRLVLAGAAVGAAGVAIAAAAGSRILQLVFGAAYAAQAELLVWLMAVGLLAYVSSFLGYALTATRRFAVQLPLFTATALACAGACRWLIPSHGLRGAAWAWGGALLAEAIASWILVEAALRERAGGAAA